MRSSFGFHLYRDREGFAALRPRVECAAQPQPSSTDFSDLGVAVDLVAAAGRREVRSACWRAARVTAGRYHPAVLAEGGPAGRAAGRRLRRSVRLSRPDHRGRPGRGGLRRFPGLAGRARCARLGLSGAVQPARCLASRTAACPSWRGPGVGTPRWSRRMSARSSRCRPTKPSADVAWEAYLETLDKKQRHEITAQAAPPRARGAGRRRACS